MGEKMRKQLASPRRVETHLDSFEYQNADTKRRGSSNSASLGQRRDIF